MKWQEIPIPVLISAGVLALFLLIFVGTFPFVTAALEEAQDNNRRLTNDLRTVQSSVQRARDDYNFVVDNQRRFEEALESDEIIPHTRRAAARQLQTVALNNGLTALNYNFANVTELGGRGGGRGAARQTNTTDAYLLHTETVSLELGAPLDRSIYGFIEELVRTIPGTAIVTEVTMSRAEQVTTDMLNRVALGQPSGIVSGSLQFSWRTAQANRDLEQ